MKLEQVLEEKNNTLVYSEQAKQNVQDEQNIKKEKCVHNEVMISRLWKEM